MRTFIFSELGFLRMWWEDAETTEQNRSLLVSLIKEGRFEIINGAVSASDNACPCFEEMINNYEVGQLFLLN